MMGEAFGKGFQYGKRKISSMSNEQFNALTADDLGKSIQTDYNQIIPHLGQAVKQSSDFQSLVIKEIIDVIKNLPADIIGGFTGTSTPETTSTAASVYGVSGTVTDVRQGGRDVRVNESALQEIEELARLYMEKTGIADFERAKNTIIKNINIKNQLIKLNASIKGGRQIVRGQRASVTPRQLGTSRMAAAKLQQQERIANQQQRVTDLEDKLKQILQQGREVRRRLLLTKGSKSRLVLKKLIKALIKQSLNTQKVLRTARIQLQQLKR